MAERICVVEECDRPAVARGWCSKHHTRWRKWGDPEFTLRPTWHQPPEVRFFAKVDASGDCWEWTSDKSKWGYGVFNAGPGQTGIGAHLWLWRHLVGPVPDGMELDHLCRNTSCVNPDHLEPVPKRVNVLRSHNPMAINARKTHCPQGHPYDEGNTRVYRRPGGDHESRYCRACMRERSRRKRPVAEGKV